MFTFRKNRDFISELTDDSKPKKRRAVIAVAAVSALAVVTAVVLGSLYLTGVLGGNSDGAQSGASSGASESGVEPGVGDGDKAWEKQGAVYPTKYGDWELESFYNESSQDDILKKFNSNVFAMTTDLPREAAGFTSDKSKAFDESGGMNPLYSYWTDESFKREVGVILERFLSPGYGDWMNYLRPNDNDELERLKNKFKDVYTERWYNSDAKDLSKTLPILADWSHNMDNIVGSGWLGVVDDGTVSTTYNEERQQYSAKLVAHVSFYAYNSNAETVVKHGVLTLNLVDNSDNIESEHTVLVDSSSLEVTD